MQKYVEGGLPSQSIIGSIASIEHPHHEAHCDDQRKELCRTKANAKPIELKWKKKIYSHKISHGQEIEKKCRARRGNEEENKTSSIYISMNWIAIMAFLFISEQKSLDVSSADRLHANFTYL